jgi:VIT1/CCC1 family predicted Fe2+/Mn2+ transporter
MIMATQPHGDTLFFVVTGLAEGMLTALILAAGRMLEANSGVTAGLAARVGAAAALPEAVVFFAAEYSRQRNALARMARQLNLTEHGRLAATRLGRRALSESLAAALLATVCAFAGAVAPLLLTSLLPPPAWLSLVVSIGCLALLGYGIAYSISGCKTCWSCAMAGAGAVLGLLGAYLKVL